jgi:chromosome segregation ATPase
MGEMNSHNQSVKAYYENQTASFKADIQKLKKEHVSAFQLQTVSHQKEISELTSKHKLEASSIQNEMQKAYEDKFSELEQENQNFSKKSKEEHARLKQLLMQYENNYIKVSDYEQDVREEVEKVKQQKEIEMQEIQNSISEDFNNKLYELENNADHFKLQYEEVSSLLQTEKQTSSQLHEKLNGIESKYDELRHRTNELLHENGRLKGELDNDYKVRNLESKIRENKQLQKEIEEITGKTHYYFRQGK